MTTSGFQVSGNAPEAYERYVALIMTPFVQRLLDEVHLAPDGSLLDTACGPGFVARAAAARLGAGSRIVGLDVNGQMIAAARRFAAQDAPAVEWVERSALDMPFGDGEFAATVCQQGVQFMPDCGAAVREMSRVTSPGGRVAVTFWMPLDQQPFFGAQVGHLDRLLGPEQAGLLSAGFRLAPEVVEQAMAAAGLGDVHAQEVRSEIALSIPLEEFLVGQIGALPVAPAFAALPREGRMDYVRSMERDLGAFRRGSGEYVVPFASHLVSGTRA